MAGAEPWPVGFVEDSGCDCGIVGASITMASIIWAIVAWVPATTIWFCVGLVLFFVGLGLVGLADLLRALLSPL